MAYLDFDGHTVAECRMEHLVHESGAPFDVGVYAIHRQPEPASAQAELDAVQEIWQRVSEDFAKPPDRRHDRRHLRCRRPGSNRVPPTRTFGTRLVVTNTTMVYSSCGCGGVSYVGGFDYVNPGDPGQEPRVLPTQLRLPERRRHVAEDRCRGRVTRARTLARAEP